MKGDIIINKKRLFYLDVLRCIAIIFVVLLHCLASTIADANLYGTFAWNFCVILNSFCRTGVPLFFIISGYLMLNNSATNNIVSFYKKRLTRLVIPLITWNIIYYIGHIFTTNSKINIMIFMQKLIDNGNSYHMWFVYTLIGVYLATPFLKRIIDNCTLKQLTIFLFIIIFPNTIRPFINTVTPVYIYLFEPLIEGYVGYFILGYILGKSHFNLNQRIAIYLGGFAGLSMT